MAPAECAACLEAVDDIAAARQVFDGVAYLGMRLERQNLAVDAEAADAVIAAIGERSQKRPGIVQAECGKKAFLLVGLLFQQESCRCSPERDRLIFKQAAQPEAKG